MGRPALLHFLLLSFLSLGALSGCGNGLVKPLTAENVIVSHEVPADAPTRGTPGSGVAPGAAGSPFFRFDYFPGNPSGQTEASRKRLEWWVDENFSEPVVIQVCSQGSASTCRAWLRVRCTAVRCSIEALQGEFGDLAFLMPEEQFQLTITHYVPIQMKRFVMSEWAFEVLPPELSLRVGISGATTWLWGNVLAQ